MNRVLVTVVALGALSISATAQAIDPVAAQQSQGSALSYSEGGGRKVAGIGGIFGCSADGDKQEIGAVAGGLLGGFLGSRIAGRGRIGQSPGGLGRAAGRQVEHRLRVLHAARSLNGGHGGGIGVAPRRA